MALNDVWQLTHVQEVNNTRITNVHFYEQTSGGSEENVRISLAVGFENSVATVMAANLAAGWDSLCYEVKKVGVTGQQFWRHLSTVGPGTKAGETMNAATVATIAHFTETGSHRGTGRAFISGFPVDYEERNNLNSTGLAAIDLIGDEMIKEINFGGFTFDPGKGPTLEDVEGEPEKVEFPFQKWVLSDVRVPLTKLRARRQSTRC